MGKANKKSVFDNPLLSTKVKSFRVKIFAEGALGYFLGPVLALISNSIMNKYLNQYFTDILNLTEWANTFAILLPVISVIFVVLGNIIVGKLMSKSKTKAGKARPLLLIAAPLIAISLIVCFYAPSPVEPGSEGNMWTLISVALGYNLFYAIAYPFYFTSHSALVTLSTRNSKDRSLLATISNATTLAAMGLTSMILPFFIGYLFVNDGTKENPHINVEASANAWKIFILAIILLAFIGILIEYYFTRERITEESFTYRNLAIEENKEKITIGKQAKACFKDKYWWFIVLFFFLYQLGGMMKNTSQTYFCQSWLPIDGIYSKSNGSTFDASLSIIGAIPTALGMLIVWPLSNKIGKARLIMIGAFLACAGGFIGFIDPSNFALVTASFVIKALASAPAMYISLALLADILDNSEAKNGFRPDGLTMTIYGAIMIGMSGLANGLLNGILSLCGYDVNTLGDNEALREALKWLFLGGESICYGLIAIMFVFMDVEKKAEDARLVIVEKEKAACLASGKEWISHEERIKREKEEEDRLAEEQRIIELKAYCEKKHLNYEEEEAKYQEKLAKKIAKNETKKKKGKGNEKDNLPK